MFIEYIVSEAKTIISFNRSNISFRKEDESLDVAATVS